MQFQFFPSQKEKTELKETKGRRKGPRPLSTKKPLHRMLKSQYVLLSHRQFIHEKIPLYAKKFGVKVLSYSIDGDHLHLAIEFSRREYYVRIVKTLTSQIARKMGKGTWKLIPATKIVTHPKYKRNLLAYIQQNHEETWLERKYKPRKYSKKDRERLRAALAPPALILRQCPLEAPSAGARPSTQPTLDEMPPLSGACYEGDTPMRRLPLWLKLAYTAFMAMLIPVYWYNYGPTNFLYFCDVSLILTLVGIWREDALLISMCAVGILLPQMLWVLDFTFGLAGHSLTGMTAYMFNEHSPLFLRGLSLFHGWLPFLLLFLAWKLGYDRRAIKAWTGVAWGLLLVCFFFLPGPDPNAGLKPVNINYVWGMSDAHAQTWVHPYLWLGGLLFGMPLLVFLPTHLLLRRLLPRAA